MVDFVRKIRSKPPISQYCSSEADGWDRIPAELLPLEKKFSRSYVKKDAGIQIVATVINPQMIHVSIAPMEIFRPELSKTEFSKYLNDVTPEILKTFFGNLKFIRQPSDAKYPHVKHYFGKI